MTSLPPPRIMSWVFREAAPETLLSREWMVTNGLGGFASGTVPGAITRRYHGLLVAALPAPFGRMVMWSHLAETLLFAENDTVSLGTEERIGGKLTLSGADYLKEFRLEAGLPVWRYQVRDLILEKRVQLLHEQNTVHVSYQVSGNGPRPRLELRPAVNFRHYGSAVDQLPEASYAISAVEGRYEITHPDAALPPLRMKLRGGSPAFTIDPRRIHQVVYRSELDRGYDYEGDLWSPGAFRIDLAEQENATLIGSTETWETIDVLAPPVARAAELERRERLLERGAGRARGIRG